MSMFSQFRYHLNHAINVDPQNWRVLLLEAQAQVVIYENLKALKNADGQIPDTIGPLQPLSVVEQKLANCLSQNPNSHEAYFAQVIFCIQLTIISLTKCPSKCCVLFMGGKFGDAAEVSQNVKLKRVFFSNECVTMITVCSRWIKLGSSK